MGGVTGLNRQLIAQVFIIMIMVIYRFQAFFLFRVNSWTDINWTWVGGRFHRPVRDAFQNPFTFTVQKYSQSFQQIFFDPPPSPLDKTKCDKLLAFAFQISFRMNWTPSRRRKKQSRFAPALGRFWGVASLTQYSPSVCFIHAPIQSSSSILSKIIWLQWHPEWQWGLNDLVHFTFERIFPTIHLPSRLHYCS